MTKPEEEEEVEEPSFHYVDCRIVSINEVGVVYIAMREPVITRSINVTKDELIV